jgi:hypothetical protein
LDTQYYIGCAIAGTSSATAFRFFNEDHPTMSASRCNQVYGFGLLIGGKLLSGRGGKIGGLPGGCSPRARKVRATARGGGKRSI